MQTGREPGKVTCVEFKYATLPFLFGIPHLATRVPPAFAERLRLGEYQLRAHAAPGFGVLLDFPVAVRVLGKVHRYFCDPARDPEDAGPEGAFRETDREGRPVFLKPLTMEERAEAFLAFHESFHEELHQARQDEDLLFHLELSVLEGGGEGPGEGPEICLGNHGGADGGPAGGSFTSCPQEDLIRLARLLEDQGFQVGINQPYAGGYDVLVHGKRWYAGLERLPVMALALDESLWLTGPMGIYDPDKGHPVKDRLRAALERFADYLKQDEVEISLSRGA